MGLIRGLIVLLVAASLSVSGVFAQDRNSQDYSWTKQSVPVLLDAQTKPLSSPLFNGLKEDEAVEGKTTLGCHHGRPSLDRREQERLLGYETVYENGTRTHTDVSVQNFNRTASERRACPPAAHTRRKRQVYGADGRFVISDSHFITKYPFSAAVLVSTGCSGILISPKHVLTAAQCVHDGQNYLRSVRAVRVGVLQVKTRRGRRGRRRGGSRRVGVAGEEEEEEAVAQVMEGGEEQNSLDEGVAGRRGGGRGRRRKGRKKKEGVADDGGIERGGKRRSRMRRSADPRNRIAFRWARVKQIRIPQGWIQSDSDSSDYNYAVLELRRPIKQKHMELGVAPPTGPTARVHFSAYDDDRRPAGGGGGEETVVYRFCTVEEESDDMIYQRCDAKKGAAGAGVYIRLRQETGDGKGKWQRRVIGVFSGHQWVEEEDGGEQRDYNAAVRITPLKYAQICHWIHTDPNLCTEV